MNVNTHVDYGQDRWVTRKWFPLLVIGLLAAVDALAIWLIAGFWDQLKPYLPWAVLAVVIVGLIARARSALRLGAKTPLDR